DLELTVERSHGSLRPGCGAAFSIDVEGEERLVVAQEVDLRGSPEIGSVLAAIRQGIAEQHELQPYEVVLLKPGSLPKTSSGKVQRHACRKEFLGGQLEVIASWRSAVATTDRTPPIVAGKPASSLEPPPPESIVAWLVEAIAART